MGSLDIQYTDDWFRNEIGVGVSAVFLYNYNPENKNNDIDLNCDINYKEFSKMKQNRSTMNLNFGSLDQQINVNSISLL